MRANRVARKYVGRWLLIDLLAAMPVTTFEDYASPAFEKYAGTV